MCFFRAFKVQSPLSADSFLLDFNFCSWIWTFGSENLKLEGLSQLELYVQEVVTH